MFVPFFIPSPPDLNTSEELVRLNRRGLGTGLLWGRIVPAVLVVAAVGAWLLWAGAPRGGTSESSAQIPVFGRPLASATSRPAVVSYGHLPLMFEPNLGQTDSRVKFLARGNGYGLFLTSQEAVLTLRHSETQAASILRMKLAGARAGAQAEGNDRLPGQSNYLMGNNPALWHTDVPRAFIREWTWFTTAATANWNTTLRLRRVRIRRACNFRLWGWLDCDWMRAIWCWRRGMAISG
jgi:hypothetical protein